MKKSTPFKKIFDAGKRCAIQHPDDNTYDKIHFERVMKKVKIPHLIDELKTDKDLRRAYHDNIAMAFKDNYSWYAQKTGKKVMSRKDRHIIANNAAEYFLKLLCDEFKVPEGR